MTRNRMSVQSESKTGIGTGGGSPTEDIAQGIEPTDSRVSTVNLR